MALTDPTDAGDPLSERKRRPRYSGTHPKRFNERYKELHPHQYPDMHDHVAAQGRTPAGTHLPVLVDEVLAALNPQPGDIVADCTLGYGGHALAFLRRIAPAGRLVGFDVDGAQLARTAARLKAEGFEVAELPLAAGRQVSLHRSHFAGIGNVLAAEGIDGYDIIFADLGVSSMQIDDPSRGFSYKHDGPLDMRMDDRLRRTAADLLAGITVEELSRALRELADEKDCERIARAIVSEREGEGAGDASIRPIRRSRQLVQIILQCKGMTTRQWREIARAGGDEARLHPAAKTFQALRILVNDELNGLRQLMRAIPYCLRPGGRVGIISFHSGEDRIVERALAEYVDQGLLTPGAADPIRPTPDERRANPRSASAKLRWAAKPPID